MKKKRIIWAASGLAMVVVIVVLLLLPGQDDMQVGKAKIAKLSDGQAVTIDTEAEGFGVQRGDAFSYFVDVLYNPEMVDEIDTESLVQVVNLEPFEIRQIQKSEFQLDSSTWLYRIEYTLQLLNGEVDKVYEFPSIVLRYKPTGNEGYMEYPAIPESIYVLSRIPDDIEDIFAISGGNIDLGYGMLRPLFGEVLSINESHISWVIVAVGVFFVIGAVADYTLRVLPQRRREKDNIRSEKNKFISDDYILIYKNKDNGIPAEDILYQVDHLVRMIIMQKENLNPIEDLNPDLIPLEIRDTVVSLFENTQKALQKGSEQQRVEESLAYMDKILRFYFKEEVDSWKS